MLRPYRGRVVLIYGHRSRFRFFATSGWRETAPAGLEVRVLRGTHDLSDLLDRGGLAKTISEMILHRGKDDGRGA